MSEYEFLRSNLADLSSSPFSLALAFLLWFLHFYKLIRCGGTTCLENDCITFAFSGFRFRHMDVAYVDDST